MALPEAPAETFTADLHRKPLGVLGVVFFVVAASAPLTVVAGGTPTAFGVSGLTGVPLVYLLCGVILAVFSVGYAAMSRHVASAGALYSYVARGLGPAPGVGAAFIAVIAYNAIQISVYGLFGSLTSSLLAKLGWPGVPWYLPTFLCIFVVLWLGVLRVDFNAKVLAVMLTIECVVIVAFDIGSLASPGAGSVTLETLAPPSLGSGSFIVALCLVIAGYTGFESAALYSEECKDPRRTVARAIYIAIGVIAVFYAVSAWAMSVATGPDQIVATSTKLGTELLFSVGADKLGPWFAAVAPWLYLTSLFACLLSFHNAVSRYLFALGRDGVLPRALGQVREETGAPVIGAFTQSIIAFVVVGAFAFAELDPVTALLVWLSGLGSLGFIVLMAMTSIAVIRYFWLRTHEENQWSRLIAPGISAVALAVLTVVVTWNFDVLLGDPDSVLNWVLPGLVIVAGIGGTVWGQLLRTRRPDIYRRIGHGGDGAPRSGGLVGFHTTE